MSHLNSDTLKEVYTQFWGNKAKSLHIIFHHRKENLETFKQPNHGSSSQSLHPQHGSLGSIPAHMELVIKCDSRAGSSPSTSVFLSVIISLILYIHLLPVAI
jgi:hypothetical protein